jgi:transcriptional regulator with XRE-family HTH domain
VSVERIEFRFGRELAAWRARAGVSQTALAVEIGIDPSTLRNWEKGRVSRPPHREIIEQIEALLNVSGHELLGAAGYQSDSASEKVPPELQARITAIENQLELLIRELLSD